MVYVGLETLLVPGPGSLPYDLDVTVSGLTGAGTVVWTARVPAESTRGHTGDYASAAVPAADGVYLAGWTESGRLGTEGSHGRSDSFVLRYSDRGDVQWARLIGGDGIETGAEAVTGSSGSVYVAGTSSSDAIEGQTPTHNAVRDIFVAALDPTSGGTVWLKRLSWSDYSRLEVRGLGVDDRENLYILLTYSDATTRGSDRNRLASLDRNGRLRWRNDLPGGSFVAGTAGGVYLAASTSQVDPGGPIDYAASLSFFDESGQRIWTRGLGADRLLFGLATNNKGDVAVGMVDGSGKIELREYDNKGEQQDDVILPGPHSFDVNSAALAYGDLGQIFLATAFIEDYCGLVSHGQTDVAIVALP